ncbi:DUF3429 domain-containing protein [Legionella sp. 227]|uniref:DUF3429 domain-containing protein n=1 Tax=Legionella sp. 227 TaxID=3367288 RepID=UPI00370DC5AA
MVQKNSLVIYLTYLGALPFLIAAFCSLLGITELPYLGVTQPWLNSYATLIAGFMAGTIWGYVVRSNSSHSLILLASVLIVLILWVLWGSSKALTYPAFLVPIYLLLWCLDYWLLKHQYEDRSYFKMRTGVTVLVIASLLIIYFK